MKTRSRSAIKAPIIAQAQQRSSYRPAIPNDIAAKLRSIIESSAAFVVAGVI